MFEMSDRFPSVLTESEDEAYSRNSRLNVDQVIPQTAGALEQKIVLPRGSGQCRFEPQPYYYLASKSGAVPSWVIDQASKGSHGGHLNS
jgi:hypothetical protein